jgi:hypothetical protein
MNPTERNAAAAFYALTPAERVSAAVRLIRVLWRELERLDELYRRALEQDIKYGCRDGDTYDIQSQILSLMQCVMWLERRYDLIPQIDAEHLREKLEANEPTGGRGRSQTPLHPWCR